MNELQRFIGIGAYINSALYLVGVFVAAFYFDHQPSAYLAIISAGLCFLSYYAQMWWCSNQEPLLRWIAAVLSIASILAAALAGLALIWR